MSDRVVAKKNISNNEGHHLHHQKQKEKKRSSVSIPREREEIPDSFLKRYKVLEKIGEGSYSEVLRCKNRTDGTVVACKRLKHIYKSWRSVNNISEIATLRAIEQHVNILQMLEIHYDDALGKVSLVFELMDINLYELIKDRKRILPETRVRIIMFQLLRALRHLHKIGIFHRDIKPENILMRAKTDELKLGDLGSVRGMFSKAPYTEYISTRWYRSPECLLTAGHYCHKMDIWAAGCVFYEVLTLRPLFPGSSELDQINRINEIFGPPSKSLLDIFRKQTAQDREPRGQNQMNRRQQIHTLVETYTTHYIPEENIKKSSSKSMASNEKALGKIKFSVSMGTGLERVLPSHVSRDARELLKQCLCYDPAVRASAHKAISHGFFYELRDTYAKIPEKVPHKVVLTYCGERRVDFRDSVELKNLGDNRYRSQDDPDRSKPSTNRTIKKPSISKTEAISQENSTRPTQDNAPSILNHNRISNGSKSQSNQKVSRKPSTIITTSKERVLSNIIASSKDRIMNGNSLSSSKDRINNNIAFSQSKDRLNNPIASSKDRISLIHTTKDRNNNVIATRSKDRLNNSIQSRSKDRFISNLNVSTGNKEQLHKLIKSNPIDPDVVAAKLRQKNHLPPPLKIHSKEIVAEKTYSNNHSTSSSTSLETEPVAVNEKKQRYFSNHRLQKDNRPIGITKEMQSTLAIAPFTDIGLSPYVKAPSELKFLQKRSSNNQPQQVTMSRSVIPGCTTLIKDEGSVQGPGPRNTLGRRSFSNAAAEQLRNEYRETQRRRSERMKSTIKVNDGPVRTSLDRRSFGNNAAAEQIRNEYGEAQRKRSEGLKATLKGIGGVLRQSLERPHNVTEQVRNEYREAQGRRAERMKPQPRARGPEVFCSSDDDVVTSMRRKFDSLINQRAQQLSECLQTNAVSNSTCNIRKVCDSDDSLLRSHANHGQPKVVDKGRDKKYARREMRAKMAELLTMNNRFASVVWRESEQFNTGMSKQSSMGNSNRVSEGGIKPDYSNTSIDKSTYRSEYQKIVKYPTRQPPEPRKETKIDYNNIDKKSKYLHSIDKGSYQEAYQMQKSLKYQQTRPSESNMMIYPYSRQDQSYKPRYGQIYTPPGNKPLYQSSHVGGGSMLHDRKLRYSHNLQVPRISNANNSSQNYSQRGGRNDLETTPGHDAKSRRQRILGIPIRAKKNDQFYS